MELAAKSSVEFQAHQRAGDGPRPLVGGVLARRRICSEINGHWRRASWASGEDLISSTGIPLDGHHSRWRRVFVLLAHQPHLVALSLAPVPVPETALGPSERRREDRPKCQLGPERRPGWERATRNKVGPVNFMTMDRGSAVAVAEWRELPLRHSAYARRCD